MIYLLYIFERTILKNMKIMYPDFLFAKTTNITVDFLKKKGIKNLLLDVDNTLTTHKNPTPWEGIEEWTATMKKAGINMIIISNNYEERVAPFAKKLGLLHHSFSMKPLPFNIFKCMEQIGGNRKNTAIVGDQILTDILGGNITGMTSILVLAIKEEGTAYFDIKRKFEKGFIKRHIERNGDPL